MKSCNEHNLSISASMQSYFAAFFSRIAGHWACVLMYWSVLVAWSPLCGVPGVSMGSRTGESAYCDMAARDPRRGSQRVPRAPFSRYGLQPLEHHRNLRILRSLKSNKFKESLYFNNPQSRSKSVSPTSLSSYQALNWFRQGIIYS